MRAYSKKSESNGAKAGRLPAVRSITVRAVGDGTQGILKAGAITMRCALGRSGVSARKREGDGATPLASLRIISGYFRGDRLYHHRTRLKMSRITRHDGWCDAPQSANYNRRVKLPFTESHEVMHRDDRLYDVVIVLDWNFSRRARGRGSAIFLHVARPGLTPTEGCIALTPRDMGRLLPLLSTKTKIKVIG